MAKKEKLVDLGSKAEKVTEEELAKLQEVVKGINTIQLEIGRLEAQKHEYLHNLSNYRESAKNLQDELQAKYGSADINLVDGSINRESNEG